MRCCATWSAPNAPTNATTAGRRGGKSACASSMPCSGAGDKEKLMATTIKRRKPAPGSTEPRAPRAPVRGAGSAPRKRPTLSQAQAQRAEREARYQEQLRQRFGDKPRDDAPRKPRPTAPPPARPRQHPEPRAIEHAEVPGSMRLSKRMSELGLAPAGRLDIDSVGLLVLTQDGRIAKQLIGEDSETEKEYLVRVQTLDGQPLPDGQLALLNHGLELDGEALRPAQVEWVNDDQL